MKHITIIAIIMTLLFSVCFAEPNIAQNFVVGDNAVFNFGLNNAPTNAQQDNEYDYRGDANMTFDHVLHTPPEGGDAQEMLRVSGASFRLVPITDPEISDRIFSVWVQASTATEIEIIGGETDVTMNVGTTWSRIITELDGAADVVIAVPNDATVYFYKAQFESGNRATDWVAAPEDDDEIGGRNLLPKDKYYVGNESVSPRIYGIKDIDENSVSGYGFSHEGISYEPLFFGEIINLSLKQNENYILSFTAWIDADEPTAKQALNVDLLPDWLPEIKFPWSDGITPTPTRYKWVFNSPSADMQDCMLRFFNDQPITYNGRNCYQLYDIYITDIQLEKGSRATDWTPAPEDSDELRSIVEGNTDKLRSLDAIRAAGTVELDGFAVRPIYKDGNDEWQPDYSAMYTIMKSGSFRIIDPKAADVSKATNGSWIALPTGSIIDDAVIENIPGVCVVFRMREAGDGA